MAVRLRRQQGELFGDVVPVRHFAVVSNIGDTDVKALLEWYRGKAATIEHVHHILKVVLDGGADSSGKQGTNSAWLRLRVITHCRPFRSEGLSGNTRRWGSCKKAALTLPECYLLFSPKESTDLSCVQRA